MLKVPSEEVLRMVRALDKQRGLHQHREKDSCDRCDFIAELHDNGAFRDWAEACAQQLVENNPALEKLLLSKEGEEMAKGLIAFSLFNFHFGYITREFEIKTAEPNAVT